MLGDSFGQFSLFFHLGGLSLFASSELSRDKQIFFVVQIMIKAALNSVWNITTTTKINMEFWRPELWITLKEKSISGNWLSAEGWEAEIPCVPPSHSIETGLHSSNVITASFFQSSVTETIWSPQCDHNEPALVHIWLEYLMFVVHVHHVKKMEKKSWVLHLSGFEESSSGRKWVWNRNKQLGVRVCLEMTYFVTLSFSLGLFRYGWVLALPHLCPR